MKKRSLCYGFLGILVTFGCGKKPLPDPPVAPASLVGDTDPSVRLAAHKFERAGDGWALAQKAIALADAAVPTADKSATDPMRLMAGLDSSETPNLDPARKLISWKQPALNALAQANLADHWTIIRFNENEIIDIAKLSEPFPEIASLKDLVKLEVLASKLELLSGRSAKAAEDLIQGNLVAQHLISGDGTVVHYVGGISCQSIVLQAARVEASNPSFAVEDLKELLAHLESDPHNLADTFRVEYNSQILRIVACVHTEDASEMAQIIGSDSPEATGERLKGIDHPFERRKTAALTSQTYALLIQNADSPWAKQVDADRIGQHAVEGLTDFNLTDDAHTRSTNAKLAKIDNPVGRLFAFESPVGSIVGSEFKRQVILGATRIILAAQIYRRTHGKFPTQLKDLVTEGILKLVPVDPYTGLTPFRYDAKRGVLWSVGPNGTDEGGIDLIEDRGEPKDLVWAIDGHRPSPPKLALGKQ